MINLKPEVSVANEKTGSRLLNTNYHADSKAIDLAKNNHRPWFAGKPFLKIYNHTLVDCAYSGS